MTTRPSIAIVGAGAMGGWCALKLQEAGACVTLYDFKGPGNPHSSSGDDSRVFRHTYANPVYTKLAKRARTLWLEYQARWNTPLYRETGLLWLVGTESDQVETQGMAHLKQEEIPYEILSATEIQSRYPGLSTTGIRFALFEQQAGFLYAETACKKVVNEFIKADGIYLQEKCLPCWDGSRFHLELSNGSKAQADYYLFACGSWLGTLFPDWLGQMIRPTRQELFYFSLPQNQIPLLPVWADHGEEFWYGIPDPKSGTFKIANDTRGLAFDPDQSDRIPSQEKLDAARTKMASRFPFMAKAPLVQSRVCHYENTPDFGLIFDHHPESENLWVLGGGSGHGFKHGPALGELVASQLLNRENSNPEFLAKRFSSVDIK